MMNQLWDDESVNQKSIFCTDADLFVLNWNSTMAICFIISLKFLILFQYHEVSVWI